MNDEFTSEEATLAFKYIKQHEKSSKMWIWLRWVLLLSSIALIGSNLFLLTKANKMREKNKVDYTFEGITLKTEILDKYIADRVDLLRLELELKYKTIAPTIIGAFMLGFVIGNWNRHLAGG